MSRKDNVWKDLLRLKQKRRKGQNQVDFYQPTCDWTGVEPGIVEMENYSPSIPRQNLTDYEAAYMPSCEVGRCKEFQEEEMPHTSKNGFFATDWEIDNRVETENKYRHLNRERKQEMEWQIAIYFLELLPRLETFWNPRVFALDHKTLFSDFCVLFDLLQLTWPYYPSRKVTYFQLRILYFSNPRYAK